MTLENVILTSDTCRYCLMCRHVCPVGHVTNLETLTPHGWGLTIASARRGLLPWSDDAVATVYHCADCGTCRANCVTDQPLPDAIAAARAELVERGLAGPRIQQLGTQLERWGTLHAQQAPQPAQGTGDAALLVGDEAHYLRPATVTAALALLKACGWRPVPIAVGRSSGYVASSLGFPALARSLAEANLAELAATGARRLFVLSPGDFDAVTRLYHERLGVEVPGDVVVEELVVHVADQAAAGKIKFRAAAGTPAAPPAYAYVDPSHAVRVAARHPAPRRLLAAVMAAPARELFWRADRAHPTGATSLQFSNPGIAALLTRSRLDDARACGVELAITEAAGDLAALDTMAGDYGIRLQGLFELLADRLE